MEWIEIKDKNNLPEEEVLAANFAKGTFGYKEKIVGYLDLINDHGHIVVICCGERIILSDITHYIKLQNL